MRWAGKLVADAEEAEAYVSATTTSTGLEAGRGIDRDTCLTESAREAVRGEAGEPRGEA